MAKIKIEDLPKDATITEEEMRKISGGIGTGPLPEMASRFRQEASYVFVPEFMAIK